MYEFILAVILFLSVHTYSLTLGWHGRVFYILIGVLCFGLANVLPSIKKEPMARLKVLADGIRLLVAFLATTAASVVYLIYLGRCNWQLDKGMVIVQLVITILAEMIVFWNGIIRVYTTSVQLGIKWRVIGAVCGWIPIAHLFALGKIIGVTSEEVKMESQKIRLNATRKDAQICKTKYPILLVHGVFFRDYRFFDYWGRIPGQLKENGAVIYYGQQQSAASIEECGHELAERIREIVKTTGCEKVNVIAHSKGGLDTRAAIAKGDCASYIASLTTINTPHNGCIFADYLLNKIPEGVRNQVASKYNGVLRHCGDKNPDFLSAVQDLTASSCEEKNKRYLDHPDIYYQSVGSKMNCASSGQFPLNLAYPLVKHFDGAHDGLISVTSAKWGDHFTFLTVPTGRGISHGDMIDLNRENIKGFDVREFYVQLVADLKERGY